MIRLLLVLTTFLLVTLPTSAQTRYTWNGGTATWTEASNWTPAGVPAAADTAVISSGTATLTANTTVAGFELSGSGVLTGNAEFTVTSAMTWVSQFPVTGIQGDGTVTIAPGAILQMTGDDPNGRYAMSSGRTLVSQGQTVWEASAEWGGTGQFVNEGELILAFGETDAYGFCFSSVPDAIANGPTGLIRRTGSGEALLYCGFSNAGTVRVENGSLALRGFNATGGTDTGGYEVEAAGTLVFSGGHRTMTETAAISGEGTVEVQGGTTTLGGPYDVRTTRFFNVTGAGVFNLDGDATTDTLAITSGTLGGGGTLTVADAFIWAGGTMRGSGTTIIPSTATLSISGEVTKAFHDTRTLRNEGVGTWSGSEGFSNSNGTLFLNAGVLEVSAGTTDAFGSFFGGAFTNTGTFTLTSSTVTRFGSFFHNEGMVEVVSGALVLSGFNANGGTDTGAYTVAEEGRLEFSGGNRTLTESAEVTGTGIAAFLGGTVTNGATWRPGASPGILTVESNYPVGNGVLEMELGGYAPGTEHDVLAVTGTAALGGTLRVALVDDFVPQEGDRFTVLTAGAVTGTFAALDLPGGVEATVETTDTTAVLVVGAVVSNEDEGLPPAFALHPAYPNPLVTEASIRYEVPSPTRVRLALYDVLGREIVVLADAERAAGTHTARLDGRSLASGLYVVRMTAEAFVRTQRLTLVR